MRLHTSRVVQKLRNEQVISWERDLIATKDWDRMIENGESDPTYLRRRALAGAAVH